MSSILPYLRQGQVLSLESTTYPGTTDEELLPLIEKEGVDSGERYFSCVLLKGKIQEY